MVRLLARRLQSSLRSGLNVLQRVVEVFCRGRILESLLFGEVIKCFTIVDPSHRHLFYLTPDQINQKTQTFSPVKMFEASNGSCICLVRGLVFNKLTFGKQNLGANFLFTFYNQINMLEKNSFLNIFGSCYDAQKQQNQALLTPSKLSSIARKSETKISLKKNRHQSFRQVEKPGSANQLDTKGKTDTKIRNVSIKQNMLGDNSHGGKRMPKQKIENRAQKCNEHISKTCQFPPTKKLVNFLYQTDNRNIINQLQLQKTIKNMNQGDKEKCLFDDSSQKTEKAENEVKELNKQKFIQSLGNYKQSLVSITFETGNQPRFQQSIVEMNYFNPPTSKAVEIEEYLVNRT